MKNSKGKFILHFSLFTFPCYTVPMIQLKSLTLKSNIIQSPMAGCTDLAFRLLAREKGMEFAFLEMVSADALIRKNAKTFDLMKSVPEDRPLGAQLVGCDPDVMGEAAAMVEEMGFDLLDINCGCPVPKVTAPGGGSALLLQPEKTKKIFEKVVQNIQRIPVTAKMRKGYSDPSGEEAVHIAKIAEDSGLSAITVHGRTRAQGYTGSADWEAIGKVKNAVRIPVFGNGDVISGEDAQKLIQVSGCDGIMIGRGGLGNPWIYKEIEAFLNETAVPADPTLEEQKQMALRHLDLVIHNEGERRAILQFRKIGAWYFKDSPGIADFRGTIHQTETASGMREAIENFGVKKNFFLMDLEAKS
ncbi:MAG: tRNA dihydrouridine synthase DusB [Chlamydiae bacterium]|nr:tRNA dihydrouridine synthase DusB [Chlamydiota bacterium]MBI3266639.1 tRNA dihydrouridine synthase DusB [Chlamydiota bacterium]